MLLKDLFICFTKHCNEINHDIDLWKANFKIGLGLIKSKNIKQRIIRHKILFLFILDENNNFNEVSNL